MSRSILDEAHIHPAIRETIANTCAHIVREVACCANEAALTDLARAQPAHTRRNIASGLCELRAAIKISE
jgi:hypothetical protein